MKIARQHSQGFTLLELLVAIAVFAVLAVMAYGTLSNVLQTQNLTQQSAEQLHRVQQAMMYLERDLLQIVVRPIRDNYGFERPAVFSEELGEVRLELTRTGHPNPNLAPRSVLQRISYVMPFGEDHKLYRYVWPSLDRVDGVEPHKLLLLDDVEEMIVRFYDDQGEEQTSWGSVANPQTGQISPVQMPRAIKVVLKLKSMGEIWRLLEIPRG